VTKCWHEAAARYQRARTGQGVVPALELSTGASSRQPYHLANGQPVHHRLSVPDYTPLRLGTLNSILRAVAQAKQVEREAILKSL